jgi:hypothetical protein
MIRKIFTLLIISLILAACSTGENIREEEKMVKTINAIVKQELASTPSLIPSTLIPTELPTQIKTASPTPSEIINSPTLEPTMTPSTERDVSVEEYGPTNFPKTINPLTGLQVNQLLNLDRRPISVKISNYPRGIRPQWGLSYADHVFEYYHESGLTRFNAIFYSNNVHQFGPIRSGRLSDADIINMYKAFFAFGSADYRVRNVLYSANFANRLASATDYPCPPTSTHPLCRIDQEDWNHLVGNTDRMREHFENLGVTNQRESLDGLYFNTLLPSSGQPAGSIFVRFSQGSYHKWLYQSLNGEYFRLEDTVDAALGEEVFVQSADRLNNQPISADNVIILLADYRYYSLNPEIVEIDFSVEGQAYIFRENQAYIVNWHRVSNDKLIGFSKEDGTDFPLKPGQTWFVVVGTTTDIENVNGDWFFDFNIP